MPGRPTSLGNALLPLVPAVAWSAFPFFSDFSTAKRLILALLLAPAIWSAARVKVPVRSFVLPGLVFLAWIPALAYGPGGAGVRETLVDQIALLVIWWAAAGEGRALLGRLPDWLLVTTWGVLFFRFGEWVWPEGPLAIGALAGSTTLGNPDLTAEFLGALVPLMAWLVHARSGLRRWAALGALSGSLTVVATHESLTALLSLGAGLVVLAVGIPTLRTWQKWAVGAVVAVVLPGAVLSAGASRHIEGRAFLYAVAMDAALERPLAGHGEAGFGYAYMEAQGRKLAESKDLRAFWTNARDAHCAPLHTWVERGIIPALALLVFWLAGLWGSRRGPPWVAAVVTALLVASSGSVAWHHLPFVVLAYLLLAASTGPGGTLAGERWPRLLAPVLAVAIWVVPVWHAVADLAFVRGETTRAIKLLPDDGRLQFAHGQILAGTGDAAGAVELLEASLLRHPNLATLLTLGNVELRQGHFERAEEWYLKLLQWKPDFAPGYANIAWLYHQWQRPDLAQRYMTRATSLRPGDGEIRRIKEAIEQADEQPRYESLPHPLPE